MTSRACNDPGATWVILILLVVVVLVVIVLLLIVVLEPPKPSLRCPAYHYRVRGAVLLEIENS